MENQRTLSPIEGLNYAVNQLISINVPVGLTEQISIPLARSVDLIRQCIPMVIEKPAEAPKQEEDEPVVLSDLKLDEAEGEEKGEDDGNA